MQPLTIDRLLGRVPAPKLEVNIVALVIGDERYVILYDAAKRAEALRTLGRWAAHPLLSFTWYSAAVLSQKIREGLPK